MVLGELRNLLATLLPLFSTVALSKVKQGVVMGGEKSSPKYLVWFCTPNRRTAY